MNRTDFIRSLGLGTSGLILPANPLISIQSVKIYDRGLIHYDLNKIRDSIGKVEYNLISHRS